MERISNLNYCREKKKIIGLIHKVYLSYLKNSREYIASTKTKSEVRGGGRKPWRQKGTGQARAGSNRSPLWRGGGITFGPKPRTVCKKINKKERKLAIIAALYLKKTQVKLIEYSLFENLNNFKTKNFIQILVNLKLPENKKILIILPKISNNLFLASRNIKNIEITTANTLNLSQLLHATTILLCEESLTIINKLYGKF